MTGWTSEGREFSAPAFRRSQVSRVRSWSLPHLREERSLPDCDATLCASAPHLPADGTLATTCPSLHAGRHEATASDWRRDRGFADINGDAPCGRSGESGNPWTSGTGAPNAPASRFRGRCADGDDSFSMLTRGGTCSSSYVLTKTAPLRLCANRCRNRHPG